MMKSFIYILIALPYYKPPTLDIKGTKLQVPSTTITLHGELDHTSEISFFAK